MLIAMEIIIMKITIIIKLWKVIKIKNDNDENNKNI